MQQRRVVIADHDPQGRPRLREHEVAAGEVLVEHGDVRVHWETLDEAPVRRTDTHQQLIIVLDGQLEVPDAAPLVAGDTLIVATAEESMAPAIAEVLIATVAVDPTAIRPDPVTVLDEGTLDTGVRRVILGDAGVRQDGEPPQAITPTNTTLTQVWQTGGPLARVSDGGDVTGPYAITPVVGGVLVQSVQQDPLHHVDGDNHWHATPTIDVDVLIVGELELALPDLPPVVLAPGDIVVQYGTKHAWTPRGTQQMRLMAIMIDAPELAEER